jgi:prepilin-type N-terminal cleavage/methylation domain-containing protein
MHLLNVRLSNSKQQGFTLIEVLIVVVIIGILSAIATPSVLAHYAVTKLNNSLEILQSSLELSQAEAMKTSKSCTVNIPDGSGSELTTTCSAGLSNNTFELDDEITVSSDLSGTPKRVIYSFKGTTNADNTITLSSANTSLQKCLVISPVVGLIRTGNMEGGSCVKSQ